MTARFAFVTGNEFGRRAFEGILASDAYLTGGVLCSMLVELDRSRASTTVGFSNSSDLAVNHGIPVVATTDGSLASLGDRLRETEPHYLLVIGWSRLVAAEILDLPAKLHGQPGGPRNTKEYGCIGMHPTRLPQGRGRAPIPWTIIHGLRSSALSVFNLEDGADTGPILAQYDIGIRERETAASLFSRFSDLHFHAGLELGNRLAARTADGAPQDEAHATVWPKRSPTDGRVSLELSISALDSMIRALTGPYPRAYIRLGNHDVRVVGSRPLGSASGATPGTIMRLDGDELVVVWGSGEHIAVRVDGRDLAQCTRLVDAGASAVR